MRVMHGSNAYMADYQAGDNSQCRYTLCSCTVNADFKAGWASKECQMSGKAYLPLLMLTHIGVWDVKSPPNTMVRSEHPHEVSMSQQDVVCCRWIPVITPAMRLHKYMGSAWFSYPAHTCQSEQAPKSLQGKGVVAKHEMQSCIGAVSLRQAQFQP